MNIRDLFDRCAESYDRDRRKLVPCFDDFYGTVLRLMPFKPSDAPRILDLGAGTGLLSGLIAEAFPHAWLKLTDVSDGMLEQARRRFAGRDNVYCAAMDHVSLAAKNEYDVVVSAISIHHLSDPDKVILYERVFEALKPGGRFVNADQVKGPTPKEEERQVSNWLKEVRATGISEASLREALERTKADQNATLDEQLRWLKEAGFQQVSCWYEHTRFAVFGGTKKGG